MDFAVEQDRNGLYQCSPNNPHVSNIFFQSSLSYFMNSDPLMMYYILNYYSPNRIFIIFTKWYTPVQNKQVSDILDIAMILL